MSGAGIPTNPLISGTRLAALLAAAGLTIADNKLTITGSATPSKTLVFECDNQTASTAVTLNTGAQTVSRQLSIPVLGQNSTIAVIDQAQSFAGTQTFTGSIAQTGTGTISTGTGAITLNGSTTIVTGKTLTVTDLTSGRVIYSTTAGLLTTAAAFTFDGTNLAVGGSFTFGSGSSYANGRIYNHSTLGTVLALQTGATYDFYLGTPTSGLDVITVPTGTQNVGFSGNIAQTGAKTFSTGTGTVSLNGNVTVASGKTITAVSGIIFSNETLTQYDEGTWTPTLIGDATAGTQTYGLQEGRYTRIGNRVTCDFYVILSAKDAAIAGLVKLGGLPFTIKNTGSYSPCLTPSSYANITFTTGTQLSGLGVTGGTTVYLQTGGSGIATGFITVANLGANAVLSGSISFEI